MIFHDVSISENDSIFAQYECSLTEAIMERNNRNASVPLAVHWIRVAQTKYADEYARVELINRTLYENVELGLQVTFVHYLKNRLLSDIFTQGLHHFGKHH